VWEGKNPVYGSLKAANRIIEITKRWYLHLHVGYVSCKEPECSPDTDIHQVNTTSSVASITLKSFSKISEIFDLGPFYCWDECSFSNTRRGKGEYRSTVRYQSQPRWKYSFVIGMLLLKLGLEYEQSMRRHSWELITRNHNCQRPWRKQEQRELGKSPSSDGSEWRSTHTYYVKDGNLAGSDHSWVLRRKHWQHPINLNCEEFRSRLVHSLQRPPSWWSLALIFLEFLALSFTLKEFSSVEMLFYAYFNSGSLFSSTILAS